MDWLFEQFFKYLRGGLQTIVLSVAKGAVGISINISQDFWNDSIIDILMDFSVKVNWVVFVLSLIFLASDIASEASVRGVDWGMVIKNFIISMLFVYSNRWIGVLSMQIVDIVVKNVDLTNEAIEAANYIDIINNMGNVSGVGSGMLSIAILAIASIIFFFVAILRFGAMLIHIFSSSFYISGIIRGDTSKMGEWFNQTAAISCTFLIQYLLYYAGLLFYSGGHAIKGLALMLSITLVGKALQKFGFSTGMQNTLGNTARMASFGVPKLIG